MKDGRDEKLSTSKAGTGAKQAEEKTQWQLQQDIDKLEKRVSVLQAQIDLPLTSLEVTQLRTVLADKKEKLGDHDAVMAGVELIAKLDGYLNPELPFEPITTLPLEE